jgi:hypothetical protein
VSDTKKGRGLLKKASFQFQEATEKDLEAHGSDFILPMWYRSCNFYTLTLLKYCLRVAPGSINSRVINLLNRWQSELQQQEDTFNKELLAPEVEVSTSANSAKREMM